MLRILFLPLLFTIFSLSIAAQTSTEQPDSARTERGDTISLGEVEVEGAAYVRKDDHVALYMKERNTDYGTNALDAISSLSRFINGIGNKSLTNLSHENVALLINGVPSDGMTLRTYQGKEILKVEYYDHAPLKYMNITKGPIVNVITRKRIDRLYSAYANGWHGLNESVAEYQGALTYADSLNQVKVNYYNNHGNLRHHDLSRYDYPDGITNEYAGSGRSKHNGNNLYASYQYFNGKNIFNASVTQYWGYSRDRINSTYSFDDAGIRYEGNSGNRQRSDNKSTTLSLFYQRNISKNKAYNIIVSGGYADAWAKGNLWRESEQNEALAYDIHNYVKNRAYSLSVTGNYQTGKLYFGTQYYLSRINQTTAEAKYHPTSQMAFLYTGYSFSHDNMSLTPSAGMSVNHTSSSGIKNTKVLPYISLYYNIWAKDGKFKGVMGSAHISFSSDGVAGGELTGAENYVDNRFIIRGNPNLHTVWSTSMQLRAAYYRPDGKLSVQLDYNPTYADRNNAPVIFGEGGYFYREIRDLGSRWIHNLSLNGKWDAADWLTFSPYFGFCKYDFETPSKKVNLEYCRFGGSVNLSYKELYLYVSANMPVKNVEGDIYSFSGAQYASGLTWKHGNYSLGFTYHYASQRSHTTGSGGGFSYLDHRENRANTFQISGTIYLSKGKARKHPSVSGGGGVDNGLRDDYVPRR